MAERRLHYSTKELISKFSPALTSHFDVYIDSTTLQFNGNRKVDRTLANFMAYEAVLPGTSYELGQVFGDREGITEQYPTKRVYPPIDVSFYVDRDYELIKFFEEWMSLISPNKGIRGTSYRKFNYPNKYETKVIISKFEKEFRYVKSRLNSPGDAGVISQPIQVRYLLLNAYPSNIISLPVSYSQSDVLRTTVTFNYDLYSVQYVEAPGQPFVEIDPPSNDNSVVRGPSGGGSNLSAGINNAALSAEQFQTDRRIPELFGTGGSLF